MTGGGGSMKNSGFSSAAKGSHLGEHVGLTGKRVGDRQKEHLRSPCPASPAKRPRTCGLILVPEAHPETRLWPA